MRGTLEAAFDNLNGALGRLFALLPSPQKQEFLEQATKSVMTRLRQKCPRLRLDPESYQELRQQVLELDGWRCQRCGSLTDLQVHHVNPRSWLGDDTEENLITLCASCHQLVHLAS